MPYAHWLGYRLDLMPPYETFLTGPLVGWLRSKCNEGVIKRWFYLWYSEGGYHLRLRLQPGVAHSASTVSNELEHLILQVQPQSRIHRQAYDRTALAFGENRESVLAELLHAATSELAVGLMISMRQSNTPHPFQWVAIAAASVVLMERSIPPAQVLDTIDSWICFARGTIVSAGFAVPTQPFDDTRFANALERLKPSLQRSLANQETAERTVGIIRRLRTRGPKGRFVVIHGLHLFLNEMGLTMGQEYLLVNCLRCYWIDRNHNDAVNPEVPPLLEENRP